MREEENQEVNRKSVLTDALVEAKGLSPHLISSRS